MNKINLPDVNYHFNSATIKIRISTIPRMLDSGANIIAIHPENSMTMIPTHTPLQASTATGSLMESTAEARLTFQNKLNNVPQQMFQGHVLPSLARHTIVVLGVLCDHGCVVVLTGSKAYVLHKNKLLLTGARKKGQLWYLHPMDSGGSPTVNEILDREKMRSISKPSYLDMPIVNSIESVYQTKILKYAIQFHYAAFNNHAKSTLLTAAIKVILPLWPLLTKANISKYVTETQATHMGHMQRIQKNLRSTRKEVPLYLQNLENEGIDIEQEKKCNEV